MRKSTNRFLLLLLALSLWQCEQAGNDHDAVHGEAATEHLHAHEEDHEEDAPEEHGESEHDADAEHGEDSEDHADGEHEKHADETGHQGEEEHSGHDGHGEHGDELLVRLTDEGVKLAGITTAVLTKQTLQQSVLLPGEVVFNEEKLAHVAPRFEGIIKDVAVATGNQVGAGDVLAVIENNEHITRYNVTAPLSGRVIEKHAVRGEFATPENTLFVIADLATVWVICFVNQQYESIVREGQRVMVRSVGADQSASGTVDYLPPVIDPATRSLTARIVLPNQHGKWRPGQFVDVEVSAQKGRSVLAVERDALQHMGEKNIVFVPDGNNSYKPVEVIVGERDATYTEIVAGLDSAAVYVAGGAFELKAQLVTSTLGEHAGHGH
jgi:membrane fusion protein, heavy metal efflux system